MTCAELKDLAAAYALGVLPPDERAAVEAHLAQPAAHEGCLEALRQAQETVTLLALAEPPIAPSPASWPVIERALGAPPSSQAPRWREWAAWLAAAAAILLLVFSLRDRAALHDRLVAGDQAAVRERTLRAQCSAELDKARGDAQIRSEALSLLQRPDARLIALQPQGAVAATANVIFADQRAFVVGHGLSPSSGKDYELWLIRGDKKIPAGILRGDSLVMAVDPALLAGGAPDAMAVTLEAAGGRPQPEGPIVLVGKI
jgi:anti-sigma-K factor RskA